MSERASTNSGTCSRSVACALVLTAALGCRHDADELTPSLVRDVGTWLKISDQPACESCVVSQCKDVGEPCIDDMVCRSIMEECSPANPGCAQLTDLTRAFSFCVADECLLGCDLGSRNLECVGVYPWLAPVRPGPVTFHVKLNKFQDFTYQGVASVAICLGPRADCDEAHAVQVVEDVSVSATYSGESGDPRPFFHVTGEGLHPMLFYEDAVIYSGTRIVVPALSVATYTALIAVLGAQVDPSKGTLNAAMYDCNADLLVGVTLVLERAGKPLDATELGTPYYFATMFPAPTSVQPATSNQGQGGFVNLAPGLYDLRAYLGTRLVGTIDSVMVEPGTVTHVNLLPLSRDEVPVVGSVDAGIPAK